MISPIVAAAFCMQPRPVLTPRQQDQGAVLNQALPEFIAMRALAMRFRSVLRGDSIIAFDRWIRDANTSGIYAMRRFSITLQHHLVAVRNALLTQWSNGQTEGQINRHQNADRALYGRADVILFRARMLPLPTFLLHQP